MVLLMFFFVPTYAGAVDGQSLKLFPCDGPSCTFNDAISVVNALVKTLFVAVLIITPLLIAKAGYHFIIGGNKPAERDKGRNQLKNIAVGLLIIACSYAVVKIVLSVLIKSTTINVAF